MKLVLIFCTLLVILESSQFSGRNHVNDIVRMFRITYSKYHGSDGFEALLKRENPGEVKERLSNFRSAVEDITDINDNKKIGYTAALSFVSVMTDEEVQNLLNLNRLNLTSLEPEKSEKKGRPGEVLKAAQSVDWIKRGAMPPVKNQGSCGSCWAFSATSALEGNYYILTGDNVAFSDQEYLDCAVENEAKTNSRLSNHDGCNGGMMSWAFRYTKDQARMAAEEDFTYKAQDRQCNVGGVKNAMKDAIVKGWQDVKSDKSLLDAASRSVVSVAIQVGNTNFAHYRTGTYECKKEDGCNCYVRADHAVAVVGYAPGYWNIRNSWGDRWGDGGYIKMSRAQDNICFISTHAITPTLQCRKGHKCKGWEDGDDNKDGDEEEDKDEEKEFDTGKSVKCGKIKHYGGLCVDMDDTADRRVVLTQIGCDREFCLTSKGYIQDRVTDQCLTTQAAANNEPLRFWPCKDSKKWKETEKGFKLDPGSKCWHPYGGSANPREDTVVVTYSGCDEDRLTFKITETICWEEESGKKLGKRLKDNNDKPYKKKKLDDAKEVCVETDGCEGIYFTSNKYFLSGSNKLKTSAKKGDKAFVMKACDAACEAGKQRCEDGKCREQCEKGDDDCPAGTTRCPDGFCKHVHMC